jgi:hypothetical protein
VNSLAPGEEVLLAGEMSANRKDRVFEAKATARNAAGATLAEATGKYLPIKAADLSAMAADFVGDARWLLERQT